MADACLMSTYITISTVARFKNIFASWSRTDYVQKGSHRRNGNGRCMFIGNTFSKFDYGASFWASPRRNRVLIAFCPQPENPGTLCISGGKQFIKEIRALLLPLSRRLFFAKQFRHPLTDFRSVFFIAGPMCNIMVRFPNGSRTHISLSAESSLKVRSEQRQDFKLVKKLTRRTDAFPAL